MDLQKTAEFEKEPSKQLKKEGIDMEEISFHGVSPCLYRKGLREEIVNAGVYCSSARLHECIERGILSEVDIIVFRTIYQYRCVTKHTLGEIIAYDESILNEYKRSSYKHILNKLVKLGLLRRHIFHYERGNKTCSTPSFYTLSYTAREYVYKTYVRPGEFAFIPYPEKPSICDMLKNVIFLQFHTSFLKENRESVKKSYTYFQIHHKRRHYEIYGLYRFMKEGGENVMDLIALPIRNNEDCIKELSHDLGVIEEYMKNQKYGFLMPVYVFICESSSHAGRIHEWMQKSPYVSLPYLFLIDQNLMDGELFGKMFSFEKDGNGADVLALHQFAIQS